MYTHFLVPLDDTPLSAANVASSVALARSLDAQITFFHATPDLAATGEGSLLLTMDPDRFAQQAPGETHAVLNKAVAERADRKLSHF
jgi:nucleotide-binding universal stress UspA family protein